MGQQTGNRLAAGFARRDITPAEPCFLVGYPHVERTSTGAHDPLYASALCLSAGTETLLLLSLDWLYVSADWIQNCRSAIKEKTGIPAANILINATHTHSGPVTAEIFSWRSDPVVPPVDPAYLAEARTATVAAAEAACSGRTPAEGSWVTADASGIAGGNRIDPEGPEDPEAKLLFLRHADSGAPLALLSVYGMHPTVLHEDSTLFSGDFIADTRRELEERFPGLGVVYLTGVCGNQSPRRVVRAQTFAEAERIGRALGAKFAAALALARDFRSDFSLAARSRQLELESKTFPSAEEARQTLEAARERFGQLQSGGAPAADVRTAECTVFGAERVHTLAQAEASGELDELRERYRRAEIQVLRIGPVHVVAWPGEFFVEYGLEVKRRTAADVAVATLSNGELQGYVVTPEADAQKGYEAQASLFPPETGTRFVEATLRLLGEMSPSPSASC